MAALSARSTSGGRGSESSGVRLAMPSPGGRTEGEAVAGAAWEDEDEEAEEDEDAAVAAPRPDSSNTRWRRLCAATSTLLCASTHPSIVTRDSALETGESAAGDDDDEVLDAVVDVDAVP